MIQRIQTVYLSLAICALSVWFVLPLKGISRPIGDWLLRPMDLFSSAPNSLIASGWLIAAFCTAVLGWIATMTGLLSFKNRKRQLAHTRLAMMACAACTLLQYLVIRYCLPADTAIAEISAQGAGWGFYAAPVALLFIVLAQRGIKADEELVKSLDRIR